MRRIAMAIAAAGIAVGSLAGAQSANAAAVDTTPPAPVQPSSIPTPVIKALNCAGWTGVEGCGPGWFWRDGWRGWGCYPC